MCDKMKAYVLVIITGEDEDCYNGESGESLEGYYATKKLAEKAAKEMAEDIGEDWKEGRDYIIEKIKIIEK